MGKPHFKKFGPFSAFFCNPAENSGAEIFLGPLMRFAAEISATLVPVVFVRLWLFSSQILYIRTN
jgi:hypothetical protein